MSSASTSGFSDKIEVVCISDTHNARPSVPDGDILIHAGDLTSSGKAHEIRTNIEWISSLPHPIKIIIGGNHDKALDAKYRECAHAQMDDPGIDWLACGITYLEHSNIKVTIRGRELKVFGSPFTPEYGTWAFQYPQFHRLPERAREVWEAIPLDIDILVTHGPPLGYLDMTSRGQRAGCPALLERLWQIQPTLHVFGHIHEARGTEHLEWSATQRLNEASFRKEKTSKVISGVRDVVGYWLRAGFKAKQRTQLVNASIRPSHFSGLPLNEAQVIYL